MTPKMTDEDVEKVLKNCISGNCRKCPSLFYRLVPCGTNKIEDCHRQLHYESLKTIKRQQKEIETRTHNCKTMTADIMKLHETIKKISAERDFYREVLLQGDEHTKTAFRMKLLNEQMRNERVRRIEADIERLEADNERLKLLLEEAEAKENRLAKQFYKSGVKDVVERLKRAFCGNSVVNIYVKSIVDEVTKELVGGSQ